MVKMLNDAGWHSCYNTVAGHVLYHNSVSTNEHVVTYCDASDDLCTAAHLHIVAYHRSLQLMVETNSDLLIYLAVLANFLGRDYGIIRPPPMSVVEISRAVFPLSHQQDSSFKNRARL